MMKSCTAVIAFFLFVLTSFAQKQPEWVQNPPLSNEFYIGINYADKTADDFISLAKSRALKDLSSQIIVNISSETFLKTTEIDNEVKQNFQENIRTTMQRELEGYELVDTWQDKQKYWVYYRLSKSAYRELRRQKFEAALSSASEAYNRALAAEKSGDFALAIQSYIYSTGPLEPFLGESFDAQLKNRSNEIMSGAFSGINNILASSRVVAVNKSLSLKAGSTFNENLNTKVVFSNNGTSSAIRNFPLKYTIEKGKLDLTSASAISNSEGFAQTILTGCSSPDKKATLRVSLDLEELLKEQSEDLLIVKSLRKKACSYDIFNIELKSPTVFFVSDEKNLSKKMSVKVLEPAVKDLFKEMGFTFVPNKAQADYIVNITADTRTGGQAFDLSVSYLDANILISENSTSEQIYSKQFAGIKGVKQDHIAAGNEAYRKVLTTGFKNEMFAELREKFQ